MASRGHCSLGGHSGASPAVGVLPCTLCSLVAAHTPSLSSPEPLHCPTGLHSCRHCRLLHSFPINGKHTHQALSTS